MAIPFYDFGGSGQVIHFSHANGYPPASFQKMISPLLAYYRVLGAHHRPLWPNSHPDELTSWDIFADDLIQFLESQELTDGIIGMGHSLGAVVTMMVALKRPSLFTHIILIDPVFLPPHILKLSQMFPRGAKTRNPLVQSTLRRRNQWADRQVAFEQFRAKKLFARWPDETLQDYVNSALIPDGANGFKLAYSREWEAQIYSTPPANVWQELPKLTHPTLAVHGAESTTLNQAEWERWQKKQPTATFVDVDGAGHMVPMERPLHLAQIILNYLS